MFWLLELQSAWNVVQWGALVPEKINFRTSMYKRKGRLEQPYQVLKLWRSNVSAKEVIYV